MNEPNLKFNWGAFLMTLPFGFANKAWMCFLSLIPGIGFIFSIIAGFCGARWAYESGEFATVEEFNAVMKSWNRAGKIMFWVTFIFLVIYFVLIFGIIGIGVFSEIMNELSYY